MIDDASHYGDTAAAVAMQKVIDEFRAAAIKALVVVQSDDGEQALTLLVDEALPSVSVWLARCRDEGVC